MAERFQRKRYRSQLCDRTHPGHAHPEGWAPGREGSRPAREALAAVHNPRTRPAAAASAATPATATTTTSAGSYALTPTSVAVVAAVFVLAGMVAAGFRARARLGRLG